MSDEEAGGQYLCRFAARRSEAGQTGGTPQLVDLGGDVDTHQGESLREAGTQEVLDEGTTAGTRDSGGDEGVLAALSRECGQRYGAALKR